MLTNTDSRIDKKNNMKQKKGNLLMDYKEQIKEGDFSSIKFENDNEAKSIKESYPFIDNDFIQLCLDDKINRKTVYEQLESFCFETELESQIQGLIKQIPMTNQNKAVSVCLDYYDSDKITKDKIKSFYDSDSSSVIEVKKNEIKTLEDYKLLKDFLGSLCFDLVSDLTKFFSYLEKDEKKFFIADNRGKDRTLEEIGKDLSLTRERIRQILNALYKNLYKKFIRERIGEKIALHFGSIFSTSIIVKMNFKYNYVLNWFLTSLKDSDLHYSQELNSFVYKDLDNKIWVFIDSLSEIISEKDFNDFIKQASFSLNVPLEITKTAFLTKYTFSRGAYSKASNTMKTVIYSIISNHFPNGIKVYDNSDLTKFRKHAAAEFSSFHLPDSKKALSARIVDYCQLIDQGTYYLKQKTAISDNLKNRLRKYIINNGKPLLFIKVIYEAFSKELNKIGIINKPAFHGVLKELFEDEFVFTKDYVSSEPKTLSIKNTVIETIKNHVSPMNKLELLETFPNLSYYIVTFSENNEYLLSYRSSFFHVDNIKTTENEKNEIRSAINKYLATNKIAYVKLLYFLFSQQFPEFLKRNYANDYYSFYALLEYVYKDDFFFKRPLIATLDSECKSLGQWLKSYYNKDIITISELSYFKNHVACFNELGLTVFANICNDSFLIKDNNELILTESTGITKETVKQIEEILLVEDEDKPLSSYLVDEVKLPEIKVQWTQMLLFSAIFRWSTKFCVSLTSNSFNTARPMIRLSKHKCFAKNKA